MLDIKVDDFLDFTEKMQNLEDILQSYIPSDEDLDTMRREPDKYMLFMNYYMIHIAPSVKSSKDLENFLNFFSSSTYIVWLSPYIHSNPYSP